MSSTDADAAAIVELFNTLYLGRYCNVAASVLFLYHAIITSGWEVTCFWTAKRTGASLLFFANKWISMAYYVMFLVSLSTTAFPDDKVGATSVYSEYCAMTLNICSCSVFSIASEALQILQFFSVAVFSALRAYVLSRSKPLGLLVFGLSLAPVGANLVRYGYDLSGANFPPFGCLSTVNTTVALDFSHIVTIIARVPLIAADILLIGITWIKLNGWGTLRDIRLSKRLSLSDILFGGGVIYFLVLFTLNVLHLTLSLTALAGTSSAGTSDLTIFTAPITAILISNFLLELQEANQTVVRLDRDDPLHLSRNAYDGTPSFIASLGGIINPEHLAQADHEDSTLQVRSRSTSTMGEDKEWGQAESPRVATSSSSDYDFASYASSGSVL